MIVHELNYKSLGKVSNGNDYFNDFNHDLDIFEANTYLDI